MPRLANNVLLCAMILFCGLPSYAASTTEQIKAFKQSWTATALKLQREIDLHAPLNEATFIGTHNSYNAESYQIPLVRYLDPNQTLSIYDQLEMGMRSIELDTHWTLSSHFSKDILLCHALPNHLGCSTFDRPVKEGLQEIRDWLRANPNEIVLLYIERHLEGHEPQLAVQLEAYLGEFIFKPDHIRNGQSHTCLALPGTLTKSDVLNAGKQVIIVTKECDKLATNWNDTVFAGTGPIPSLPLTFLDSPMEAFTSFPDCGRSAIFASDAAHTSLWRTYEDRTTLYDATHPNNKNKVHPENMKELTQCGINWITLDKLSLNDTRLNAAIWSWAPSYPRKDQGQCAIYKQGEGIQNRPCQEVVTGFACQEAVSRVIRTLPLAGTWTEGESICQLNAGKNWHFTVPVNGYQMHLLKEAMTTLALSETWINYASTTNGNWLANGIIKKSL